MLHIDFFKGTLTGIGLTTMITQFILFGVFHNKNKNNNNNIKQLHTPNPGYLPISNEECEMLNRDLQKCLQTNMFNYQACKKMFENYERCINK